MGFLDKLTERERALATFILIAFGMIITELCIYLFTKALNPYALVFVVLIIEQLIVVPCFIRNYKLIRCVLKNKRTVRRYLAKKDIGGASKQLALFYIENGIPVYKDTSILEPIFANGYLCFFGLGVIAVLLSFIPATLIGSITSMHLALTWSLKCLTAAVLLYIIASIIRGVGYLSVYRDIEKRYRKMHKYKGSKVGTFIRLIVDLFAFFPVLRTLSIVIESITLGRLVRKGYNVNKDKSGLYVEKLDIMKKEETTSKSNARGRVRRTK